MRKNSIYIAFLLSLLLYWVSLVLIVHTWIHGDDALTIILDVGKYLFLAVLFVLGFVIIQKASGDLLKLFIFSSLYYSLSISAVYFTYKVNWEVKKTIILGALLLIGYLVFSIIIKYGLKIIGNGPDRISSITKGAAIVCLCAVIGSSYYIYYDHMKYAYQVTSVTGVIEKYERHGKYFIIAKDFDIDSSEDDEDIEEVIIKCDELTYKTLRIKKNQIYVIDYRRFLIHDKIAVLEEISN